MVRPRAAWTAALFVAAWVEAPPARADNEDVEVTYAASARACPAQEDFLAMVRRHTTKWNVVSAGFGARRFDVRLAPREGAVAGTLVVADGNTKTRELVGPDCSAVAEAVAIMMALAIDPESDAPPADPSPPHLEEEPPPPSPARPRPKPVAPSPSPPPRPTLTFAVSAGAEVSSAVVNDALAVFDAAFEVRLSPGKKTPLWLAPSLALGVRQSLPNHLAGNSLFTWTAGTIRVCPVRFAAFHDRISVRPCGELDVGVLNAETRGIVNARSDSSTWLDLAGSVRGAFAITRSWSAGASCSVIAPQTRQRYALETGELISQPPAVGVAGGLFLELEL